MPSRSVKDAIDERTLPQFIRQFGTFGRMLEHNINGVLKAYPGYRVRDIFPVQVQKIGGPDTEALVVFERIEQKEQS